MRFVDTNVLLYAVSTTPDEAVKAELARGLLAQPDLALSVQVLQEFFVQATRATRTDAIRHDQAARLVESFLRFPVALTTPAVLMAAVAASDRFAISYWDAAILEAARSIGCETVLSEELADGHSYDGVTVRNPFAPDAAGTAT